MLWFWYYFKIIILLDQCQIRSTLHNLPASPKCVLFTFPCTIFTSSYSLAFFSLWFIFVSTLCFPDLVTKLKFSSSLLKNPMLRDKCWVKGKLPLLRKLAILGRMWNHVPKNQLPLAKSCSEIILGKEEGITCWGQGYGVHDHSWSVFWFVGDEVTKSQYHQPSGSNPSGVIISVNSKFLRHPSSSDPSGDHQFVFCVYESVSLL